MRIKPNKFLLAIIISFLSCKLIANTEMPIQVVTSFSILENLVAELGGEQVEIVNLVGRNSDAHVYRPKPSDAIAIANADLVIMNGLGFEGWMSRLVENNGQASKKLIASTGVKTLVSDNEVDPHAWQSFYNIKIYSNNITQALIEANPKFKDLFTQRNQVFLNKVNDLQQHMTQKINAIPKGQRLVVTSHDAFLYLGREFGIKFIAPVGFNTDMDPSAGDVATLIDQIKSQNVKALFVENISNPRLLKQIASETAVAVGGSLYSDALSEVDGEAPNYLTMMRHNIQSLADALNTP